MISKIRKLASRWLQHATKQAPELTRSTTTEEAQAIADAQAAELEGPSPEETAKAQRVAQEVRAIAYRWRPGSKSPVGRKTLEQQAQQDVQSLLLLIHSLASRAER